MDETAFAVVTSVNYNNEKMHREPDKKAYCPDIFEISGKHT